MATQMESAKRGQVTEEMRIVAKDEGISPDALRDRIAKGTVIIPRNVAHEKIRLIGIGEGLRTKVNANLGTSSDLCNLKLEVKKAKTAVKYGTDTIMDLSTAGNLGQLRKTLLKATSVPFGTVPIYQSTIQTAARKGSIVDMTEDDLFNTIEQHAKDGVDFITVHCGVVKQIVDHIVRHPRLMGIVSRGGTFLTTWILYNQKENPLYANYDYLLELVKEYDVALSLGDGLRPGSIFDATDWPQLQELLILSELVKRAHKANVQVMVEGPGHLPLNHIEANVQLEKSLCKGVPFYVLGPIVTEIAPGYDHIVAAIGGAVAALAGADFLCYVCPSEHLGIPLVEDVKLGVIAMKIAAHAADIVKLGPKASNRDLQMDKARAKLDWESQFKMALDSEYARQVHSRIKPKVTGTCTMCGKYCALKLLAKQLKKPDLAKLGCL